MRHSLNHGLPAPPPGRALATLRHGWPARHWEAASPGKVGERASAGRDGRGQAREGLVRRGDGLGRVGDGKEWGRAGKGRGWATER